VLIGRNAQGKSGVLEALYLLATSKSHRTSRDVDMIRLGDPYARIVGEVKRIARNDVALEIDLSRVEKKIVKINTVKRAKIGDLIGQLNAVIFSDSDIEMVRGEPSRRRRFLNLEISQISPQYIYELGRYKRVLDQRNNLLKEIKARQASSVGLDVWDKQLAGYGAAVTARRTDFVNFLSAAAADIYCILTDGSEQLKVAYKPSAADNDSAFEEMLVSRRGLDISRATTTCGPHRDDLGITINTMTAREYASQGQQRTAAIAMKLAEIKLLRDSATESPIVLLDDIMAELDESRRHRVLDLTSGCQTFLTTTHLSDVSPTMLQNAEVYEVDSGKVRRK